MGCVAEVKITERCDRCGKIESKEFMVTDFMSRPKLLLEPWNNWMWIINKDRETYCPGCWDEMVKG